MKRPEQDLQIAIVQWADLASFPEDTWRGAPWLTPPVKVGDFLHHTPNGGARTPVEGAIFKAMGVRAGYPDLSLDIALRDGDECFYAGWRCELKVGNARLRPNQQLHAERLIKASYVFDEARSLDEFIERLHAYLERGRPIYRGLLS